MMQKDLRELNICDSLTPK